MLDKEVPTCKSTTMDTEWILYTIEYLKLIKERSPETVDEDAHNSLIKGLWEMYMENEE